MLAFAWLLYVVTYRKRQQTLVILMFWFWIPAKAGIQNSKITKNKRQSMSWQANGVGKGNNHSLQNAGRGANRGGRLGKLRNRPAMACVSRLDRNHFAPPHFACPTVVIVGIRPVLIKGSLRPYLQSANP